MNPFTGVALYFMIWWTVLFAVLPIGIHPESRPDDATGGRGAPARPLMWRKVIITTLVSAVIWVGCYALITGPWISFRHGWLALPAD